MIPYYLSHLISVGQQLEIRLLRCFQEGSKEMIRRLFNQEHRMPGLSPNSRIRRRLQAGRVTHGSWGAGEHLRRAALSCPVETHGHSGESELQSWKLSPLTRLLSHGESRTEAALSGQFLLSLLAAWPCLSASSSPSPSPFYSFYSFSHTKSVLGLLFSNSPRSLRRLLV